MKKLTEPAYTVITPKEDELLSTDPRIKNCLLLIFKEFIVDQIKTTGDIKKIKYVWYEEQDWSDNTKGIKFSIPRHIGPNDFTPKPIVPIYIPTEIIIKSVEDVNNLIKDGYIVKAYTSSRQYKKDLALYFIENKHLYHKEHLSDEQIWNEFMIEKPIEYTKDKVELNVEKKIMEIIE